MTSWCYLDCMVLQILLQLRRLERIRAEILELKQSTVAEIRSYQKPPPIVHTVMTATFLLLGHKESETKVRTALSVFASSRTVERKTKYMYLFGDHHLAAPASSSLLVKWTLIRGKNFILVETFIWHNPIMVIEEIAVAWLLQLTPVVALKDKVSAKVAIVCVLTGLEDSAGAGR